MKLLVLDVIGRKGFYEIDVPAEHDLQPYYDHLKCNTFDIVTRKIGGRYFDIFCDDEGLFVENPIVSAFTFEWEPALVGNLIFAHHDREGNTTGLSKDDVNVIKQHAFRMFTEENGEWTSIICTV